MKIEYILKADDGKILVDERGGKSTKILFVFLLSISSKTNKLSLV